MSIARVFLTLSSVFSLVATQAVASSNREVKTAAASAAQTAGVASIVPSNAKTVSNLEGYGNWVAAGDKGAVGHATGYTKLVSSPALKGPSRLFYTHYAGSGDERFSIDFGSDRVSTNFFYDAWVYLTPSASNIYNVEFDMNQVIGNGQTVIMGIQCDGYAGTWDYTLNLASAKRPHDHWDRTHQPCNPRSWTKNAWHHVQAYYSHNSAGYVTYHTVWLDGVAHPINVTVYSAFALGWGADLITNFQLDGHGAGSATAYIDNLTISRW